MKIIFSKEAVIILLDVGKNTALKSGDDTFFNRAKTCAKKIIARKIFSCPQDEIGIILFGANETQNGLNNSQLGFEGILEMGPLECPTWEMQRKLEKINVCETTSCDWVEALLVAVSFASEETM